MCVSRALRQIQDVNEEFNPAKPNVFISLFNSLLLIVMVVFFAIGGVFCMLFGNNTMSKNKTNAPYKIEPSNN